LRDQLVAQRRKLLRKVERGFTLSNTLGVVARFSSNSKLVAQQMCSCPSKSTNQHAAFVQPQQMSLLLVKLNKQDEKRETSTKNCNETMLRDKLRIFVSCILPP